ncbi:MAG: calcium/sodium antiporter [Candidatus Poseidoniaceae archaeon]|jgi:cation:H+ antiporter|nr:calcium/sodium antiporter [Candidatus Poseidoniaceae archaeon]
MDGEKGVQRMGSFLHWNALTITLTLFISLASIDFLKESNDWEQIYIMIFLIIIALALLITSTNYFIEGAKGLARTAGIAEVVIGLTIVSIGTSLPEILFTTTSAIKSTADPNLADLAIGNIYGSVLVQITLVLGIVVLFKPLEIRPAWLRRDGLLMFLSLLTLTALLWEGGGLSRIEGAILCLIYVVYIMWLLNDREDIKEDELKLDTANPSSNLSWSGTAYFIMLVIGLTMAVYAANELVSNATDVAYKVDVPHAIVGATVTGLGTSLPELTVAMVAARKSQGVAIGTLIGSNITDPLLSIGIAAMANPFSMTTAATPLLANLIIPATLLGVFICLLMMWSGYKFSRFEGIILIAFYLIYIVLIELHRQGFITL